MNSLFKTKDEKRRSICDKSIHKAMIIPVYVHHTNKNFSITVQPKNACKLKFADHLCLPLFDQAQQGIVVFAIINFQIYNIIVTKQKHGIGSNNIITFNEEL